MFQACITRRHYMLGMNNLTETRNAAYKRNMSGTCAHYIHRMHASRIYGSKPMWHKLLANARNI